MIKVFNENFILQNTFQIHTNLLNDIKQSPFNNEYVATVSQENTAKIWSIRNATYWCLIRAYNEHTFPIASLEFINEDTVVTAAFDQKIKIWSISTGITNRSIITAVNVLSLQLLGNGFYLAAGLSNGSIYIYNINNGGLIKTLSGHTTNVNDLVLINDDLLASSSDDRTICIWNLTSYTLKFTLVGHTDSVRRLKLVSSDLLASGSWDSSVKLWDITNGQLVRNLSSQTSRISYSIDLLNSQQLLSGYHDKMMKLWNFNTGELLNTFNAGLPIYVLTVLNGSFSRISKPKFLEILARIYFSLP